MPTSGPSYGCWLPAGLLLAGCAQHAPLPPDSVYEAADLPESFYANAANEGRPVYRIDPQRSLVLMHVSRAGTMQSVGHDHVISSMDLHGFVLVEDDAAASRADLQLPLQSLVVDKAEDREHFGLEAEVPQSAIEGTTSNMQDKVLQSAWYPVAEVRAEFAAVNDEPPLLGVALTLHGATFDYLVPVELTVDSTQLTATGAMTVRHSEFGLVPFSAAGGLLRVADEVAIEFELVATRWHQGSPD